MFYGKMKKCIDCLENEKKFKLGLPIIDPTKENIKVIDYNPLTEKPFTLEEIEIIRQFIINKDMINNKLITVNKKDRNIRSFNVADNLFEKLKLDSRQNRTSMADILNCILQNYYDER